MKLEHLDYATALANYRKQATALKRAALSGFLDLSINYDGTEYDPASVICLAVVREAIADACDKAIDGWETELREMGVEP